MESFDILWIDPYKVKDVVGINTFYLSHLDGHKLQWILNGKYMRIY
jgi:hypothetical protein